MPVKFSSFVVLLVLALGLSCGGDKVEIKGTTILAVMKEGSDFKDIDVDIKIDYSLIDPADLGVTLQPFKFEVAITAFALENNKEIQVSLGLPGEKPADSLLTTLTTTSTTLQAFARIPSSITYRDDYILLFKATKVRDLELTNEYLTATPSVDEMKAIKRLARKLRGEVKLSAISSLLAELGEDAYTTALWESFSDESYTGFKDLIRTSDFTSTNYGDISVGNLFLNMSLLVGAAVRLKCEKFADISVTTASDCRKKIDITMKEVLASQIGSGGGVSNLTSKVVQVITQDTQEKNTSVLYSFTVKTPAFATDEKAKIKITKEGSSDVTVTVGRTDGGSVYSEFNEQTSYTLDVLESPSGKTCAFSKLQSDGTETSIGTTGTVTVQANTTVNVRCVAQSTSTSTATPGITVTPTSGLSTTESGGTATFTVVLKSQPSADVTIAVSSSNTSEGTVSPSSLTFTSVNWSAPQTVTITGINDNSVDGSVSYSIDLAAAVSSDSNYNGVDPTNVSVTNSDNDSPGITVTPTSGLITTEATGTATFTVVLNTKPTSNVTIAVSSSNTNEGTVSPASLTFTSTNWNSPQTVTVTGKDDDGVDGDIGYTIALAPASSSDANYRGINPTDVSVTNADDDLAAINVSPTSGRVTTEAGGTDTFTVVLASQPTDPVTIPVSSSNTAEGTVSAASLTFTSVNWNIAQTVTITGVNDVVVDGAQLYTITLGAATSTDPNYSGFNPSDVAVTNTDDDVAAPAGITVSKASVNVTEGGATDTFTVVLDAAPSGPVAIGISATDATQYSIDGTGTLTFTTLDWNVPQTVTVTAFDDVVHEASPITYPAATAIVLDPATSADISYNGIDPNNVAVVVTDND